MYAQKVTGSENSFWITSREAVSHFRVPKVWGYTLSAAMTQPQAVVREETVKPAMGDEAERLWRSCQQPSRGKRIGTLTLQESIGKSRLGVARPCSAWALGCTDLVPISRVQ